MVLVRKLLKARKHENVPYGPYHHTNGTGTMTLCKLPLIGEDWYVLDDCNGAIPIDMNKVNCRTCRKIIKEENNEY